MATWDNTSWGVGDIPKVSIPKIQENLDYLYDLIGDSSDILAQLAAKAPLANPTFTGTVVLPQTTSIGTTTSMELGYVHGVTSNVQTQLNTKMSLGSVNNMTAAINENLVTIPSAATMAIGAQPANYIIVTGTTNISNFDSAQPGTKRQLRFSAGLTVVYSANMLLPGV